jgi:hypothetical protein
MIAVLDTSFRRARLNEGIKAPECQRYHSFSVGENDCDDGIQTPYLILSFLCMIRQSWRVLDISVAMAYATLSVYGKSKRMISAAAAILRGYNAVYPLTELERKHLVLLMCCRLACSVTLGAFSFQQNPENKYLLLHSEPAWEALELLWCSDPGRRFEISNAANSLFSQACLYKDSLQGVVDCSDIDLPDPTVPDYFSSVRALPMPTGHRQASKDDVND